MKLDATDLRYLTTEEFRVLTAVEMGSKNHEIVPTALISQISKLKSGGINKLLGGLAKRGLVSRVKNAKYDGYRLTYGGYDYLAIRTLSKRDMIAAVGNQIGVGKESDIYVVSDPEGEQRVLKLHRLGRISFRAIKSKRDYLGKRKSASWMYMSRLAAQKEWAFMKILHEHGFPVPKPFDQARHCILMEFIDAYPLRQISSHPSPGQLYSTLMDIIVSFAHSGLIHGDFNEFNILIHRTTGEPIVIDFPQMVSTRHANAEWYFNRDVDCIRTFFKRRFGYESLVWPKFTSTFKEGEEKRRKGKSGDGADDGFRLDVVVAASGFGGKEQEELEKYMEITREEGELVDEEGDASDSEEDSQGEDEEEAVADAEDENAVPEAQDLPSTSDQSVPEQNIEDDEVELETSTTSEEDEDETRAERKARKATKPKTSASNSYHHHTHSHPSSHGEKDVKTAVSSELTRQRARQDRRYHSKKSVGKAGRTKGSKMKSDTRVKIGGSGDGWD